MMNDKQIKTTNKTTVNAQKERQKIDKKEKNNLYIYCFVCFCDGL